MTAATIARPAISAGKSPLRQLVELMIQAWVAHNERVIRTGRGFGV